LIPLRAADLAALPESLDRPAYDRDAVKAGIVHFSVGNFHRAHQAVYLDRVLGLAGHEDWGICGVGLIDSAAERAKAAALATQDGLYTLTLFPPDGPPATSAVGSIVEYLFAPADPAAVLARLDDPAIRIVTLTVTEGGYQLDEATGQFRLEAPDIVHDLAHPEAPRTVFGFVVAALARRRAVGLAPFTVLSCDNLQHNGAVIRHCVLAFARARDPDLAAWIEAEVAFPSCMVDRITPAVTAEDAARLNTRSGVADEAPVFAEDFIQWVIEDRFCAGRPALERVGVQFSDEVAAFEQIKLRMLNATHSMLSYPALLAGYGFVDEALADRTIHKYLRTFLDRDVIPLLRAPSGMSLADYRDTILHRFGNPAIRDQLARIASDGAAKIPIFLGETLRAALRDGGDTRRLAFLFAAFGQYLAGRDDHGQALAPLEPHLLRADRALALDPDPASMLRIGNFKGLELDDADAFKEGVRNYRRRIGAQGVLATLAAIQAEGS
jgi:mannitol-1-phosphate/altronate dehydrogenase